MEPICVPRHTVTQLHLSKSHPDGAGATPYLLPPAPGPVQEPRRVHLHSLGPACPPMGDTQSSAASLDAAPGPHPGVKFRGSLSGCQVPPKPAKLQKLKPLTKVEVKCALMG